MYVIVDFSSFEDVEVKYNECYGMRWTGTIFIFIFLLFSDFIGILFFFFFFFSFLLDDKGARDIAVT